MAHVILVVDDDEDLRDTIADILEFEGYAVERAANGREALDALDRTQPCMMLLDMMMPVMTGAEVLRALRDARRLETLPVVVISAQASLPTEIEGARLCVRKPFAIDRLAQVVARFC